MAKGTCVHINANKSKNRGQVLQSNISGAWRVERLSRKQSAPFPPLHLHRSTLGLIIQQAVNRQFTDGNLAIGSYTRNNWEIPRSIHFE